MDESRLDQSLGSSAIKKIKRSTIICLVERSSNPKCGKFEDDTYVYSTMRSQFCVSLQDFLKKIKKDHSK